MVLVVRLSLLATPYALYVVFTCNKRLSIDEICFAVRHLVRLVPLAAPYIQAWHLRVIRGVVVHGDESMAINLLVRLTSGC